MSATIGTWGSIYEREYVPPPPAAVVSCKRCDLPATVLKGRWARTCDACRAELVEEARAAGTLTGGPRRAPAYRDLHDPPPAPDEPAASEPQAPEEAADAATDPYPPGWLSEERVRGTAGRVAAAVAGAGASEACAVETKPERSERESAGPKVPRMDEAIAKLPGYAADVAKKAAALRDARARAAEAARSLEVAARVYLGGLDACRNALLLELRDAKSGPPVDTSR